MTNIFSLSFSTGRHVIACYSLGRIISASVVGRCGPKLAERVGNTKEGGSRAVFLRLRGEARGRPRITLTADHGPIPVKNLFSKISPKNIYQSSLEITRTWFQGIFLNFHR